MNTHVAFLDAPQRGDKATRVAAGTEDFCAFVLAQRLEQNPGSTGFVRELTESELR